MHAMTVPYITSWSEEKVLPTAVVQRRHGIAFADETIADRDDRGILWRRVPSLPGRGRPQFGKIHTTRQRRAMRDLLCQVCGKPADTTELGTLWLIPDFRDWPGWPERMGCTEPPICLPCAHTSVRLCPALRRGYAATRVRNSVISGIYGAQYRPGPLLPTAIQDRIVPFDHPDINWTCAGQLVRELLDCTLINLDTQ